VYIGQRVLSGVYDPHDAQLLFPPGCQPARLRASGSGVWQSADGVLTFTVCGRLFCWGGAAGRDGMEHGAGGLCATKRSVPAAHFSVCATPGDAAALRCVVM